MDVAVGSVLQNVWGSGLKRVVFTYDINCKYRINLFNRLSHQNQYCTSALAAHLQEAINDPHRFVPRVNSWHLGGHIPECADDHDLAHTPCVGVMTGEDVEGPWARLDGLQYTTREMGAGHRRDVISVNMNVWNDDKLKHIGVHNLILIPTVLIWVQHTVPSTLQKYYQCLLDHSPLSEELQQLEMNVDQNTLASWKTDSLTRGGEQYRPNSNADGQYPPDSLM